MKFLAYLLSISCAIIFQTGCNDKSSDKKDDNSALVFDEANFPDSLPAVNTELSTSSAAGIWMVVSERESSHGPDSARMNYQTTTRHFIIIREKERNDGRYYYIQMCEWQWFMAGSQFEDQLFNQQENIQAINNVQSNDVISETYQFVFSENLNRFYGELTDWNVDFYNNAGYENSVNKQVYYGIKLSDSSHFEDASELTLTINSDTPDDSGLDGGVLCLGVNEATAGRSDLSTLAIQQTQTMYATMDAHLGISTDDIRLSQDSGTVHSGAYVYGYSIGTGYADNFSCAESDDCSKQPTLETHVYQNDKHGLHYELNISYPDDDGGYYYQLQPEISLTVKQ